MIACGRSHPVREVLERRNAAPALDRQDYRPSAAAPDPVERPLWQVVLLLYAGLGGLIAIVIALAFLAERLLA
jgi:hypothetical protein